MGSSSSRPQPPNAPPPQPMPAAYQPPRPQGPYGAMSNGQFYGAYGGYGGPPMPQPYIPAAVQPLYHASQPSQYPGSYGQPPPRPVPEQHQVHTATIKNQVNLKKHTLRLVTLQAAPHLLSIQFSFDASAPCRVTTFVAAAEDGKNGCKLTTLAAPPAPVDYPKGLDQRFPVNDEGPEAQAHAINTLAVRLEDLIAQAREDAFPVVVRLESLTEEAVKEGRRLDELVPGEPLPQWVQAQTTYARLKAEDDGSWGIAVLKQKIWVKGISYELQEIYGMEQNRANSAVPAIGTPASVPVEDIDGRECVICMSAERDTTVLPCRHMCMCQDCASALKTQTNKCPICRNEITSLLHIKIQHRMPSLRQSAPAAEADPATDTAATACLPAVDAFSPHGSEAVDGASAGSRVGTEPPEESGASLTTGVPTPICGGDASELGPVAATPSGATPSQKPASPVTAAAPMHTVSTAQPASTGI